MNDERIKEALDAIARRNVPGNIDTWPLIASRFERRPLVQTLRARPVLLIVVLLLSLALLSGVVYAIGHSLGYIPGVGLVEQGSGIRVLVESVSIKRDELTVTVEQVVADARHTTIVYQIDGIPTNSSGFPMCAKPPVLRLPDGNDLQFLSGGGGGMESIGGEPMKYKTSYIFPSLPVRTQKISIVFPCILPDPEDDTEEWEIPLVLVPASSGYVTPAVEVGATYVSSGPKFDALPTPTFEISMPEGYDPNFPATPTHVPNGSGLYLDKVIELSDSYILVGNFTDAGDLPGALEVSDASALVYRPYIEDANGNSVHFKTRTDIKPDVNWAGTYSWAYEIPKPIQGPITITLDKINIHTSSTVRFDFDTGPNPQPGQKWQLNMPVHIGKYDFVVDSVDMIEDGYDVRFHSSPEVSEGTSFILDIVGSSTQRGPTSGVEDRRSKSAVKYSQNITYLVSPPTGQLTIELTLFERIPLKGPWTLAWTPQNQ